MFILKSRTTGFLVDCTWIWGRWYAVMNDGIPTVLSIDQLREFYENYKEPDI